MKKGTRRILLTQGKTAIVDAVDYKWLCQWKWCVMRAPSKCGDRWYAIRRTPSPEKKSVLMHQAIAERASLPHSKAYDHHDHNGLNNRRVNLRPCTYGQNVANSRKRKHATSKFKGVYWHKSSSSWMARIGYNYKMIYLGKYDNEQEAGAAYKQAARLYFGEFAYSG